MPGRPKITSTMAAPPISAAHLRADDRYDRDQRVAHACPKTTGSWSDALGARGADEILVEHFEQAGARHAHYNRQRASDSANAGSAIWVEIPEWVREERNPGHRRDPVKDNAR